MNAMCGIEVQTRAGSRIRTLHTGYRAPLGRMDGFIARYPARWAGLRDHGPLARNAMRFRNSAVALPEHRASLAELDAPLTSLQHRAF